MVWQMLFAKYKGEGGVVRDEGLLNLVMDISESLGISMGREAAQKGAAELLAGVKTKNIISTS
jgi:hypothetical protein